MCEKCAFSLQSVWNQLQNGAQFRTPDDRAGAEFEIGSLQPESIHINPKNITISRSAFAAALHYLRENNHFVDNPCRIGANNDPADAGPFCLASRQENNNVRCSTYILPVLEEFGIVGINGAKRPNTTWLTE